MVINICDLHEFEVGVLFEAVRGNVGVLRNLDDGNTPVVAAAGYNQGIAGYYDVEALYRDTITVSCNGVGCGSSFYHVGWFNITNDALVLLPKFCMTEFIGLYLSSILNKVLIEKYDYSNKLSPDKIKKEVIKFPATQAGEPDLDYMESYMREVMSDCERKYNLLVQIAKERHVVDTVLWGEFKVGELFDLKSGKVYHTRDLEELDDFSANALPYVTCGMFNNGLKCHVMDSDDLVHNPAGVISFGAEGSAFFYQKHEYVSGRDMYYIDTRGLSEYTCLFLVSCLSTVSDKYSYTNGMFPKKVANEVIKLPITPQGEPDWVYMEDYMHRIMDKEQHVVDCLSKLYKKTNVG